MHQLGFLFFWIIMCEHKEVEEVSINKSRNAIVRIGISRKESPNQDLPIVELAGAGPGVAYRFVEVINSLLA
jgi:hypothetical protein